VETVNDFTLDREPTSCLNVSIVEVRTESLANIPAIYYVMNLWLQNFAYHILISIWTLLLSAVIVSIIAIITIAYQTVKTATSNPVKALKYE